MNKLLTTMLLAGALGAVSPPVPVDAAVKQACLGDAIRSCDADFGGGSERSVAIRGWCYMIRWGWCSWWD
jgi:hypothetical protein